MNTQNSIIGRVGEPFVVGRSGSLSAQIVADVREALFDKRLKPGDPIGTEKELAAEHATPADHARLKRLLAEAESIIHDGDAYTRSSRDFHLAIAEASHNRVLVVQFISLNHVSWPAHNRTLTPEVAQRVLAVHKELATLIEMRDAAGARRLMDDHVRMIRARRVSERDHSDDHCC